MFVTSDIYDLKRFARGWGADWQEHLVSGVVVSGRSWQGSPAGARYFLEAAKLAGLSKFRWIGWRRRGERDARPMGRRVLHRLADGLPTRVKGAEIILFRGDTIDLSSRQGVIVYGGEASAHYANFTGDEPPSKEPDGVFQATFLYPYSYDSTRIAKNIFRTAATMLKAEYGYYFIRDDYCFPTGYPLGVSMPLDWSRTNLQDRAEIKNWEEFVYKGPYWTQRPLLRDIYEMNLISGRHTEISAEDVAGLDDWIQKRPGRGELEELGDGRLLWTLTEEEIVRVRPLLDRGGWLVSCNDRVYRGLANGGQSDVEADREVIIN